MNFDLADHHVAAQRLVREFAQTEVAPRIRGLDRAQEFDGSILGKMGKLGILGLCIPARYGGAGMDYISLGLACEELEYVDTSLRVIMSVQLGLNSLSLLSGGTCGCPTITASVRRVRDFTSRCSPWIRAGTQWRQGQPG